MKGLFLLRKFIHFNLDVLIRYILEMDFGGIDKSNFY